MAVADSGGLPIGMRLDSASPHEAKLAVDTVSSIFVEGKIENLIGDKAYDSDPLDKKLKEEYGIDLTAPHKSNRKKTKTQDGRKLRRYLRRWKIERLFAWLQNFRRLVVRYEVKEQNFLAFIHLSCCCIYLRYF